MWGPAKWLALLGRPAMWGPAKWLVLVGLASCAAKLPPANALLACPDPEPGGYAFADDPLRLDAGACIDAPPPGAVPGFDSVVLDGAAFDAGIVDVIELHADGTLRFNASTGPSRMLQAQLTEQDRRLASAVIGAPALAELLGAGPACTVGGAHADEKLTLVVNGQPHVERTGACERREVVRVVTILRKLAAHYGARVEPQAGR